MPLTHERNSDEKLACRISPHVRPDTYQRLPTARPHLRIAAGPYISNPAGPSLRASCAPPSRAPARRSKPPSSPPSTASPQLTHAAGSTIAVTRFQTDVKIALVPLVAIALIA